MSRPRLLLHIGTHKTGTSGLQETLHSHRELLLQRGILYPDTRRPPWPHLPKHCSFYNAAVSNDVIKQETEIRWIMDEALKTNAQNIIISEEGLSEPDPRILGFIARCKDDFDIEILCCFRRQDFFVESLYNQFTRERDRKESRGILQFCRAPQTREKLNYHKILSDWLTITPTLHVVDFDSTCKSEGLLTWFGRVARLDFDGLIECRSNRTPDMRLALLLAALNRQRADYKIKPLMAAAYAIANDSSSFRLKYILGRQERSRILTDFAQCNQRLANDFSLFFSDELPADEPMFANDSPDIVYLEQLICHLSHSGTTSVVQ